MPQITLTVNGQEHTLDVDPDMPLLWVLREKLALTGTKYGCGEGACGICTVLLDGVATKSCTTPVSAAEGGEVLSIEGLSQDGDHPLQRAWREEDVSECGYCQPGQIMTALALLSKSPNPTDEDINQTMSAVLCRCGTYNRIRRAIHRAAEEGV
jgi:aerobic-type carbon monoxide dehydrogenase small subunit (CoxS/CutS family)